MKGQDLFPSLLWAAVAIVGAVAIAVACDAPQIFVVWAVDVFGKQGAAIFTAGLLAFAGIPITMFVNARLQRKAASDAAK